jgi:indole-3-glycerol phosphate synthase
MPNFLTEILQHKYREVTRQSAQESLADLQRKAGKMPAPLDFDKALRQPRVPGEVALIAEILTDEKFFQGHLDYLEVAKAASSRHIPVLRKDFIVDPYQVWQARAYGADALLLIMAALTDEQATTLYALARELGLGVLVEVHDTGELDRALRLGARVIGVNNRNLHTFEVSLATTGQIAARLPDGFGGLLVSESGIATSADITAVHRQGAEAVLVGETLVRAASTDAGLDTDKLESKIGELFG